jgi:hypothetical protein
MKGRPIIVELLRRPKAAIPDENSFSKRLPQHAYRRTLENGA